MACLQGAALLLTLALPALGQSQTANMLSTAAGMANEQAGTGGPIRLRGTAQGTSTGQTGPQDSASQPQAPIDRLNRASEFERHVQDVANGGKEVRRFGAELMANTASVATDFSPLVPPDYIVQTGDELVVTIWGSVEADLRVQVDRSGRINLPRVGPIMVSGVRYADLNDVISKRVGLVFKNFQVSAGLSQLRGLRVYVTGFVERPGVQVVSSLSTLAQTLIRAGGPSAAGSFRNVQLRRGRQLVTTFDLYDLLINGDRQADQLVQAEDVLFVGPIGPQVALLGSVNRPAIFEIKSGESIADLLRMAGGFAAVADTTRLSIERLDQRAALRVNQISLPAALTSPLSNGDIVRAFNAMSVLYPGEGQNKRIRIEGEVVKPGEYVLPASSTLADALKIAGGTTASAFIYGTEFTRESVRQSQQLNYERALRDLETSVTLQTSSRRATSAEEASVQTATAQAATRLVDRLRQIKPTGRVILQLPEEGGALPPLAVEDGDRLYIPLRSTVVGVFGSVFNSGSYLFTQGRAVSEYLRLAGGPTTGADDGSTFVVRANGSVVSVLQSSRWFARSKELDTIRAQPGDTIFVPEDTNKSAALQSVKDWTQIFFQLGVGAAGLKSAVGF